MKKETLNILIVDDHDIVVRGMSQIVADAFPHGTSEIATTTSGQQAIEIASQKKLDICLLDIELPDTDGMALFRKLRKIHPLLKVIINTIHEEIWYVKEFEEANVDGILFKSVNAEEIKKAVRTVAKGEKYYCRHAKKLLQIATEYKAPTPKELKILQLLACGKSTEEMARLLGVTVNTIESHRRHLLDKIGARNVAELIMKAIKAGFLTIN